MQQERQTTICSSQGRSVSWALDDGIRDILKIQILARIN